MATFEKLEKDGQVAVLLSPGYGAGWYSWCNEEGMLFDREIVEAVLADDRQKAAEIAKAKYEAYTGGVDQLIVEWVPKGQPFEVEEYDGSESLHMIGGRSYNVA